MIRQVSAVLFVVLISAVLIMAIRSTTPEAAKGKPSEVKALSVSTEVLALESFPVQLHSFGNVYPDQRFKIHALVGGQIVDKHDTFKVGHSVRSDEVLVDIDSADYLVAVSQAKANLAANELALEDEKARAIQAERDWSSRSSQKLAKDYVLRKPHLKAAEASLQTARDNLARAELDLERTSVTAGFEGVIDKVFVDQGSVISSSTIIGEGFSTDHAEIRLPVNVSDLSLLIGSSPESTLSISLLNTLGLKPETRTAQFERIESSVDESAQQVVLVASLLAPFERYVDAQGQMFMPLIPNQYVSATITGQTLEGVIVIPNELVYQGAYVLLAKSLDDALVLEKREVEVLYRSNERSIIKSGLVAGEVLVTTVLGQVPSGTRIEARQ